jgi:hypothetical protein
MCVYILSCFFIFVKQECPPEASAEEKSEIFDAALSEGIEQIQDGGYHKKYIGVGKAIYLVAFAFLGRDEIEMRTVNL